jgi:phage-Barnase-EndoU-ColicinE5/D-RelE like nuclease3
MLYKHVYKIIKIHLQPMKKEIKELVQFALDEHPKHKIISIGEASKTQTDLINQFVKEDVTGIERFIDTHGIRHAIKEHGSPKTEEPRGQIAVNLDDFELVPTILKSPDKIEYAGKNSLKQDVFIYTKEIDNIYFIAEAVRFSKKKGNKLMFETMYKRKKPARKSWF